jgi:hypothetical protein
MVLSSQNYFIIELLAGLVLAPFCHSIPARPAERAAFRHRKIDAAGNHRKETT